MASYKMYNIFALLLVATTANALTCYKCDSSENVSCNYGFTSFVFSSTVECSGGFGGILPSQCYKITATNKDGKEYVARGCLPAGGIACNALIKTIGLASSFSDDPNAINNAECSVCDGDKCNSASKMTGMTLIGLVMAAIAFIF